ncbi:MFS transporter [Pseudoalteromonas sp. T1lg65]|uniref:MFS transporter n=1 Tax=Pseudoalteromonas sp. T1lg65 TaxID=2077101 RepID=UPI003F790A68
MKNNTASLALVLVVFFVISFITNILGPIFPELVSDFEISLTLAGFLPLSFFAAYGVMSIPSGWAIERFGEKAVMITAFSLACAGSTLFASIPTFAMAMLSLFFIGTGMAMLQVAINPLLRVAGKEENFAFFSILGQLLFGAAATVSPLIYALLVSKTPTQGFAWLNMYWLFAGISVLMLIICALIRFPIIDKKEDERQAHSSVYLDLIKNKTVIMFFVAIAAYVGTEQGVANGIGLFLQQYHQLDSVAVGAKVVSEFWLMLTIGCVVGLGLVKLLDSRIVLISFALLAMLSLTAALFGPKEVALFAFPAVGFFLSVMWSVIVSLALNSLAQHHGAFTGILCTGIVGGGLASPIIGLIADSTNSLRLGMCFVYLTLGYIFYVGLRAQPLIKNKTIRLFKANDVAKAG